MDNLERFKKICDVILTNRYNSELDEVADKVYTGDGFGRDWQYFQRGRETCMNIEWDHRENNDKSGECHCTGACGYLCGNNTKQDCQVRMAKQKLDAVQANIMGIVMKQYEMNKGKHQ